MTNILISKLILYFIGIYKFLLLTRWIFSTINARSIVRIHFQRILGGNFPSFVDLQLNIDVQVDVVFYKKKQEVVS